MKKNSCNLILLFVLLSFPIAAQENILFYDMQKAKQSNVVFQDISTTIAKSSSDKNILKHFTNEKEVDFIQYNPSGTRALSDALFLKVPLKGKDVVLELLESPPFYESLASDEARTLAGNEIKHYQGIVRGEPNSIVALTFYKDEMMGLIATSEGNFNVAKEKTSGKHLIYSDRNLKVKPLFECGTPDYPEEWDEHSGEYDSGMLLQEFSPAQIVSGNTEDRRANVTSNSVKYVRLYVETEYNIYQTYGLNADTHITGLFNQVAALFRSENIFISLCSIYKWTSQDASYPYSGTSSDILLSQFQNKRTSICGDLGILLTTKSIGGIAAGYSGLCNSNIKNKLAVAGIPGGYSTVPNYSSSVHFVTHEIGHLLGSYHTHACKWNGTNTAIDGCAPPEYGSCSQAAIPAAGTIMSYCQFVSEIDFTLGFGPQPGNVIRNSVNNANCLVTVSISGPDIVPCSGTVTYSLPAGFVGTWTVYPSLQIMSGQGTNSITVRALLGSATGSSAWVSANGTVSKNVSIALPPYVTVTGASSTTANGNICFHASPIFSASEGDYEWVVEPSSGASMSPWRHTNCITFNTPGSYSVGCRSYNACFSGGTFSWTSVSVDSYYMVSQPASSKILSVSLAGSENQDMLQAMRAVDYTLTNVATGAAVASGKMSASGGTLDFSSVPTGIYVLRIDTGSGTPETFKVILK